MALAALKAKPDTTARQVGAPHAGGAGRSEGTGKKSASGPAGGRRASPPSKGAPQFVQWVYETWRDQLRLPEAEGSRKFHEFIESMGIETFSLSGAIRVQSFHIIKFGYPMRRAGYVTAAFTARVFATGSTTRQHEAYFAYAYWPREDARAAGLPEYICISPTFESRDGEYRHRFIWFKRFLEGYEALTSLLSPIERMLLEAIGDDELGIDLLFYPGDEKKSRGDSAGPVSYSDTSRLGLKALVAALAMDALRVKDNTLQNHASEQYVTVMRMLYARCAEVFSSYTLKTRNELAVFITGHSGNPYRAQCGQKLFPLTVRESLQVNDINFAPWREVWVGQRATDLVINGVAPMFPIYNSWTYLNGVDRSLFENKVMYKRYDRSAQAEAVNESLRQARAKIGRSVDTDYRMGQLDAHVYDAIAYAQDFVLLTDLAMCSTSEYVGLTIRTIPDIVRRSTVVGPGLLRMYENSAMQARYLFDLCYGAHVLHSRVGAVHADLHLNNMTIFELAHQHTDGHECYTNPTIAYIAGPRGEADTYVFPHDGFFACLIDFSRAILGPAARPQIEAESGEAFASGFYRSQVSRALRVLHHYVPTFVRKHQENIKGLLLAEPDTMFSVLTAVDFLAIGQNFGALLRELDEEKLRPGDHRKLKVAPEGIALAARIEQIALEHLVVNLTELVGGGARRRAIVHAGELVLPGAFDEFRYSAWAGASPVAGATEKSARPYLLRDATLTDVYNAAAPLEYSSTDYGRYPPWAKFDDLGRHLGGINILKVTAKRGERPFLRSLDLNAYLAVLQEHVRRGIEDAPASATSSWIAD